MIQEVSAFRLSPQQERVWLLQQDAERSVYESRCIILLEGDLDASVLRQAWNLLTGRHEILCTGLRLLPGLKRPVQVADGEGAAWLADRDLRHLPPTGQEREMESALAGLAEVADASVTGTLQCFHLGERRHALLVRLPAHLCDAAGLGNLVRELSHCYDALRGGQLPQDEPVQYNVVAEWFNELLESPDTEAGKKYWRSRGLSLLPELRLPFERPAAEAGFLPRMLARPLAAERLASLERLAAEQGVSMAALLLTAWSALLARLSGQAKLVVGTACSGRTDEELELAVGPFSRYLPLDWEMTDGASFSTSSRSAQAALEEAWQWQECFSWDGLERSVAAEPGTPPFFPFAFDFLELPDKLAGGAMTFSLARQLTCSDRFVLKLSCVRLAAGLTLELHYDAGRLGDGEVERVAQQLETLLDSTLLAPDASLADLEVVGLAERRRLLIEYNDTSADLELDRCLHELFEAQAARTPDRIAVTCDGRELSYAQLNARANRLARHLRAQGVAADGLVGICLERSPELIVALLAVLKAGGAYVPLDPEYPLERLAYMLGDAAPRVLLTQPGVAGDLRRHAPMVIDLEAGDREEPQATAAGSPQNLGLCSTPDNLAYVIYTSGSTGLPKGVMVRHRSIANRLLWMLRRFPLAADDRVLQKTPFSFDASIWELFTPLFSGARLVLASPGGHQDSAYLVRATVAEKITTLQLVPSLLRVFLAEPGVTACRDLRRVFCGGEALAADLVARFYELFDGAELHNLYGPTEVAIDATSWSCPRRDQQAPVPIGRPIDNAHVYLLDAHGNLAPEGVPGELYVGGAGLARGYLARPHLTAERFVPHFAPAESGARLYRTGDLARHRGDGAIEFLGRVDHQVKLRGFRIELGEVEAGLRRHPGVEESVVVVRGDGQGGQRLVAYVVPRRAAAGGGEEEDLYRLPNGLTVAHLNRGETDWLYQEVFADRSYLQRGLTLADGDCVFDVGANIGLFTLFVHQTVRHARVFAFEPSPPTFACLSANARMHGLDVELFDCGLSDVAREAEFTFYPQVSASSGLYADADADAQVTRRFLANQDARLAEYADDLMAGRFASQVFTRPLRRLSDVLRERAVERVDYLKLDVEKSELDVLRGIDDEDWPRIRQIAMEVHDTDGRLAQIAGLLRERGFAVEVDQLDLLADTGLFNLYAVHPQRAEDLRQRDAAGVSALLAPAEPATPDRLRDFLSARLPPYMVPSVFVLLEQLPRTPSGKVDRVALPEPEQSRGGARTAYVAPRNPLEQELHDIWKELLGIEQLGVDDNFFDLGGHSLLATQVISRLRSQLHVEVPLRRIFEAPTIAVLAASLEIHGETAPAAAEPPLVAVPHDRELPLSYGQQRLWFLDQLVGGAFYNIPMAYRLAGTLDVVALERSLNEIVRRHEVLRTSFPAVDGQPVAIVAPALTLPLPVVDLSSLAAPARAAELRRQVGEEAGRPFRLDLTPLLRATLLRLAGEDQVLVVDVHHIVFDGWSTGIFFGELVELYKAFAAGAPSPLPELPLQYADFALWQREWLRGDVLAGQLAYWRQRLAEAPAVIELPLDRPRPPVQTFNGASLDAVLPRELTAGLRELSQAAGATVFMALLTAFQALLHRYSGQPRIVVGTPIANRNRAEIEGLIGLFVNTLALATEVDGDLSFLELLARVREASLGAYAHQDVPFEQLVEALEPQRNLAHQPLFQVMFAFQNLPAPALELPGLRAGTVASREETAKFDLNLLLEEHGPAIGGTLNFNVDLFDGTTAIRLLYHLEALLRGVLREPERRLGDLELLAPGERHQLVAGWNDTERPMAGDRPLHQLFAARAALQPEAPAAFFADRCISFGELDAEANRLAHRLRQLGVRRGSRVAVLMDRSLEMLPALLGILKAGAAYVPLEPAFPAARLERILGSLDISCAITQSAHLELLGGLALPCLAHVLCLDPAGTPATATAAGAAVSGWQVHGTAELAALPATAPVVDVCGDDVAYVIFTSGSTGTPKGVVVCHRPVANLIDWVNREFAVGPSDRMLFITSLCFDLSVYDVFGLLAAGGSIRIASALDLEEPKRLLRRLCDEPVTFWDSAPAALQQLAPLFAEAGSWPGRDRLRLVFLSGDWIPVTLPDRVRELFPAARVIGLGGATEATVWSNFFPVGDVPPQWVSIPYGRPIQNAHYLVLGPNLEPCPIGVAGDLFIGGDCLCTGYAGDPAQTAEKFIPDPFAPAAAGRLYRTGDRALWRGDGNLQFLGRRDHQVKIRGFRIELGEIEAVLAQHPAVGEVIVLAREDQSGDKRLAAYLVIRPQAERPAAGELRGFVLERLPDYMAPAAFVFLEAFPVTANGKVDRGALPAPARAGTGAARASKPRDTLELKMVQDWEEVLNVRPVGILDNFFELGGNSLVAVRLMARLQKAVSREVPLATLFQSPTISSLADVLRNSSVALPVSPLVAIQPHGSLPPLFLMHSLGGEVLSYYDLARHLGPEQPVYGLQAPSLSEVGDREIVIEETAAEYLAALRAVQPEGPYFLGGYSYGAVVSFEMAQQLRRAGETVQCVALLDGYSPQIRQQGPMLEDVIYLATLARETARMSGSFIHLPHEEIQSLPRDLAIDHILATLKAASLLPPEIDRTWIDRFLQGARRREESLRRYRPQVYEGKLTLLKSTELDEENLKAVLETGVDILSDPARGWDKLSTEPLEIHTLRCHHETLLVAPHVEVLAEMLRTMLAAPRSQREVRS
ncbi:MAG TPA: amino acid adenylation domain-containing protein [Thermoanaerobaculia bacterium]|jgi:amino acid adenylation domain-containing protein/FkbM family methyltransferase|nr:amino acid adenylation domain-containing protein [Thermoanaerobaculia bacterium]